MDVIFKDAAPVQSVRYIFHIFRVFNKMFVEIIDTFAVVPPKI